MLEIRKYIFFTKGNIWAIIIAAIIMISLITTGVGEKGTENTTINSSLNYSFEFKEPLFKDFELIDKTFTEILIPGCISPGREVGSPNIPVNFVNLLIPQGHIVKDI
ncbi:MAG: hypothetical protein BV456_10215, partial [Thermoplasmata archaeon M8B2D]